MEFILDLAGYDPANDLTSRTVIEPAVGQGAFLVPVVDRLLRCARAHGVDIAATETAISGFDIDPESVEAARSNVTETLLSGGVDRATATRLAQAWVREADSLKVAPDPPPSGSSETLLCTRRSIDRDDMASYRST
ncbi:hypothetical protein [Ornithinimicrobium sp. INDO-MA30-4]|uniref:hypothetical protein n=1 Tax=Ornithinimicrobium sp. INDO-MA30-4 TaxID=2908651 RepID=UPI001F2FF09A|nr:hypothetical protein [Ornithinimicrobium sp. INDO-MA30-4]UJH71742.1 hypothetical protein L0A91_16795 [Ornithinimicrobium sp. INDO-MA30-4]